jgi:hypothetical protein
MWRESGTNNNVQPTSQPDHGLRRCELRTANCELPTANRELPAASCFSAQTHSASRAHAMIFFHKQPYPEQRKAKEEHQYEDSPAGARDLLRKIRRRLRLAEGATKTHRVRLCSKRRHGHRRWSPRGHRRRRPFWRSIGPWRILRTWLLVYDPLDRAGLRARPRNGRAAVPAFQICRPDDGTALGAKHAAHNKNNITVTTPKALRDRNGAQQRILRHVTVNANPYVLVSRFVTNRSTRAPSGFDVARTVSRRVPNRFEARPQPFRGASQPFQGGSPTVSRRLPKPFRGGFPTVSRRAPPAGESRRLDRRPAHSRQWLTSRLVVRLGLCFSDRLLSMIDATERVEPGKHGQAIATFVCRHLVTVLRASRLFR